MNPPKVVIVGAGFAGLSAAYYLKKAGWQPVVLEAADRVGGRVATVEKNGYTLDTGATQISTGYAEYVALSKELGLHSEIINSSSYVAVLRGGKLHLIDGSSLLSGPLSSLLSLGGKLTMLKTIKDYLSLKPRIDVLDVSACGPYDTESAQAYAERRLTRELYDYLLDPMIRAYVINRADDVSCLEWFTAIGNLGGEQMTSIKGGNRRMPEALAAQLDVRLNSPVQSVQRLAQGVLVRYQAADGMEATLEADACVLATRVPETAAIYPPFQSIAAELVRDLTYNRGLVVQLGFTQRPACPAIGLLMPTVEHDEIGLIWLEHNKNLDRVPAGHALFSVYFDEAACDRFYHRTDEELVRYGQDYLCQLFPELRGRLDMSHVTRWPMAVPNPATGIYAKVAQMKQRIDPTDRVQFAGDYFTCTGQNSAIHWGRRAAENLIQHRSAAQHV